MNNVIELRRTTARSEDRFGLEEADDAILELTRKALEFARAVKSYRGSFKDMSRPSDRQKMAEAWDRVGAQIQLITQSRIIPRD